MDTKKIAFCVGWYLLQVIVLAAMLVGLHNVPRAYNLFDQGGSLMPLALWFGVVAVCAYTFQAMPPSGLAIYNRLRQGNAPTAA
jgi:hypothetical protein